MEAVLIGSTGLRTVTIMPCLDLKACDVAVVFAKGRWLSVNPRLGWEVDVGRGRSTLSITARKDRPESQFEPIMLNIDPELTSGL